MSHEKLKKRLDLVPELQDLKKIVQQGVDNNPFTSGGKRVSWQEQCLVNFPLLYLASIELFHYGQERGCDTFLFATRDGCHWHRIFKALFPETNTHYFDCSRNMLERATHEKNDAYDTYVASLLGGRQPSQAVYADIHGTGKRMFNYFTKRWNKVVPHCFLITAVENSIQSMPGMTRKWYRRNHVRVLAWQMRGGPIEMLNYDLVGTLQNYSHTRGAIRDPLEYPEKYILPYHQCVDFLVSRVQPFPPDKVSQVIRGEKILKIIYSQCDLIERQKPRISKYIDHIVRHPE